MTMGELALRMLFVDDHLDTLCVLARLFRRLGCRTFTADSCAAARAVVAAHGPVDVVVGDIGLPDGDGLALLEELKHAYGGAALALTAHVMPADARRYDASSLDGWLPKPTGIAQLQRVVEGLGARANRDPTALRKAG
jgi:CheY-like chemotaxis protein